MPKQKPKHGRPENNSATSADFIRSKGGEASAVLLEKYTYRITEEIKSTIKGSINNDPVAKQYIPQIKELKILPEENTDPIGDQAHTPVKGIVHRYPDRVLFKPVNLCAVYCRYCFRREHIGPGSNILNATERKKAIDYIRNNPEIREVILTGGDPLVLSSKQLKTTIDQLTNIKHVQVIRIHTRIPIADPHRLNTDHINALKSEKATYIALHINHAQEITDNVRTTLKNLHNAGMNLLSQSVLLKDINDNAEILSDLYRELIALNVKPYYLHHPDLAPGTSHFRLSIREGQKIMRELQGKLSGLCQPTYMLDIPSGYGKVPLTPCYIEEIKNGGYAITDYQGQKHQYSPKPKKQKHG